MANVKWFKIGSWHIYKGTSRAGYLFAVCGRHTSTFGNTGPVEDRPANEKSCESCLRISGPR